VSRLDPHHAGRGGDLAVPGANVGRGGWEPGRGGSGPSRCRRAGAVAGAALTVTEDATDRLTVTTA